MKNITLFILLLTALSCGQTKQVKNNAGTEREPFTAPQAPVMMSDYQQINHYRAVHFWDDLDLADSTYFYSGELDQPVGEYLALLSMENREDAITLLNGFMDKVVSNGHAYEYFSEKLDDYLYGPNSPLRNEELYIPVVEYIVASDKVDEYAKLRPQAQLDMMLRNRVGEKANDITATLADGRKVRLYDVKSDFTIIFINNPDCHACADVISDMSPDTNPWFQELVDSGFVSVFAIYPDEDITAWHNHMKDIPDKWIYGYDADLIMRDEQTYDLKAIPSLYLLDKDKNVIIKDAAEARPLLVFIAQFRSNMSAVRDGQ